LAQSEQQKSAAILDRMGEEQPNEGRHASLAERVPQVSAALIGGQGVILVLGGVACLVGGIWWAALLALALAPLAFFVAVISARRGEWY
jgi:hypothetical protein